MPTEIYSFFLNSYGNKRILLFNNLEMETCRETMRKNIVSYDYHFEQTPLAAGECVALSWRADGDHSIHNRLEGPWTHGCDQKLALFGTFSQNFDFATIQKQTNKQKTSLCFHPHLSLSHGCEVLMLFCWQPSWPWARVDNVI